MKSISQLFNEVWKKKEERGWDCIYIMVDLHGVILPSNYHASNDLQFISPYTEQCLQWLSNQKDVKLILWSSSHLKEVIRTERWLLDKGIIFDYFNENPIEKNTEYADFSKKPYFSIGIDDKFGFEASDWQELNRWITFKEYLKLNPNLK